MKKHLNKTISLLLGVLFIVPVLFGCAPDSEPSEITQPSTEATEAVTTTAETTEAVTTETPIDYKAEYLAKIAECENNLGVPMMNETFMMETGLYYANLVDFDKNGTDELVLAYIGKDGEDTAFTYEIWAVVDNKVILADTGDMLQTGGVDPSVYIAYTEDRAYFIAGSRQSYTELDYRTFDGNKFYSELSVYTNNFFDENGNTECIVNGENVTLDEYHDTVDAFTDKFTEIDDQFFYETAECLKRVADTKAALKN